jgi:hypothetical protein
MAKVVGEVHGFKFARERFGLIEERFKRGIFYAIFAEHLFNDQFAVAADLKFTSSQLGRLAEADDQGHVFGDVVGGFPDVFSDGDKRRGIFSGENHADTGQAWIPATAAVEVERNGFFHSVAF